MLWFWSFLCFRFFLTAAAARARAEETAWEGAEEALRGNGAAPQRGGEEACRERTGSYTYCSIILRRYYCMQTDSTVPQECETRWQVHNPSLALKFSFVFPFPFKATSPPPPPSSWLTVIVLVSLNALKVIFSSCFFLSGLPFQTLLIWWYIVFLCSWLSPHCGCNSHNFFFQASVNMSIFCQPYFSLSIRYCCNNAPQLA